MLKRCRAPVTPDAGYDIQTQRACGLCGKTDNLVRTECCGGWVCDDEIEYVPFSYARNSCSRNHRRYTLCGHHRAEEHQGDWALTAISSPMESTGASNVVHELLALEPNVGNATLEFNFEPQR